MTSALSPVPPVARQEDSAEVAYQRIRQDILTGRIAPGTVLSQVALAGDLGISRTPLREALSRLITEGLVTSDFNRRVQVSELDLADFDQIYAARLALEPVGIRATIGRLGESDLAELAAHVSAMDAAIEAVDMERFRAEHRAFHLGMSAHAGERIVRMLADLSDHSERYRLAYLHYDVARPGEALADRFTTSQDEHRAMLEATVAGDADAATRLLLAHLTRTLDGVFSDIAARPTPRVARHAIAAAALSAAP